MQLRYHFSSLDISHSAVLVYSVVNGDNGSARGLDSLLSDIPDYYYDATCDPEP